MEKSDITKIYADMDKRPLNDEEISKISKDFLEKNAIRRLSDGIKVETIIPEASEEDLKNGYSWSVKITVPPGLLDPEVEAEWRRKNELEKAKSEVARPENQ